MTSSWPVLEAMSKAALSRPSRVYVSVSPSASLAVIGSPMLLPAAVFSFTSQVVVAVSGKVGALFARCVTALAVTALAVLSEP